jgi:DNA-binding MarR family transcriptional regulator
MQLATSESKAYRCGMADNSFDFDELSGCFAFRAHRFERRVSAIYDAALGEVGITVRQFNLLGQVAHTPGLAMARMAQRVLVDPTTLTRNLKPLIDKGWLRIEADTADARAKKIFPTAKGLAKLRAALPYWRRAQAEVSAALGGREADNLRGALEKSTQRLRARQQGEA